MKTVVKRDGIEVPFNPQKIRNAVSAAFSSKNLKVPEDIQEAIEDYLDSLPDKEHVENIQSAIEIILMDYKYFDIAKVFIIYRDRHEDARMIREKVNFIMKYAKSNDNAANNSNTDANANNSIKNVASLEPEVFKDKYRLIQRQFMKDKLAELYPDEPELPKKYVEGINKQYYPHDEGSSPSPKAYCGAYVTYPLITQGVGNIDNMTPTPPDDIESFSGQVTNLVFALSAQTKGAVALGDYLVNYNYYIVNSFGPHWYEKLDVSIYNDNVINYQKKTIRRAVKKGMKQFIFGVNQPQGNRGFQSPFTNVNIFDKYYFESLFGDYYYPDGTKPAWEAIDTIQRIFLALMREIRLMTPVTFPVVTMALLYDDSDYKDKAYADLCANEWELGSSHFLYNSNNADALASCCRVSNKIEKNYFTSTTGMVGLMTGSCNVITLNINRIVQDCFKELSEYSSCYYPDGSAKLTKEQRESFYQALKLYISTILEDIYKYHIAYKTILYEFEDLGMITYSNAGYLHIKKLYSTIGVLGYYEAAKFLRLEDGSEEYVDFMSMLLEHISNKNKAHSIYDKKRPFIFNLEAVPGENLAVKFYNWDKADGYKVPEDQVLYNCYFFNPWKEDNPIFKLQMHGGKISKASDGGQGCHINLYEHLSAIQYRNLMDVARIEGCNYFTFNIPMSKCKDCNHVVNAPIKECPKCGSTNIDYYTRVIGFLTSVSNWSKERYQDFLNRMFGTKRITDD